MKTIKQLMMVAAVAVAGLAFASEARAETAGRGGREGGHPEDVRVRPAVLHASFPDAALPGAWEEMKTLQLNPNTALPGRTKELIGLGVVGADPVPVLHLRPHRVRQAERRERGRDRRGGGDGGDHPPLEHVPERHPDRRDASSAPRSPRSSTNVKKASASKAPAGPPVNVVDGASALKEATQMLGGYAPEFIREFPAEARAGAWKTIRDVQLSPATRCRASRRS